MELITNLKQRDIKVIIEENNLKYIEDSDNKNIFLLKYDKDKSDLKSNLVRQCRGIILEKNTNKIVAYGLDKMNDCNELDDDLDLSDIKVEDAIDGTQLRLYYYNKWVLTTARCIDGYKSKWNYVKTYGKLYEDVKHLINYDILDKNNTYTFILRHIENRIVENVVVNELYHIHTRSNITLEELDIDIGVKKPKIYSFKCLKELKDELNIMTFESMGYVINIDSKKYMFKTNEYEYVRELKGNNYSIDYNYLELKKNNRLEEYLFFFPEYDEYFKNTESKIVNIVKNIHNLYITRFIKKTITNNDIDKMYKHIIYNLHKGFLETKEPTTFYSVNNYLDTLTPGYLIKLIKNK